MEQIVDRVSQPLAKSIATLRNQIEVRWQYVPVLLLAARGGKNANPLGAFPRCRIAAAISRKKQVFSSAASEGVSGGCNHCFLPSLPAAL